MFIFFFFWYNGGQSQTTKPKGEHHSTWGCHELKKQESNKDDQLERIVHQLICTSIRVTTHMLDMTFPVSCNN